MGKNRNRGRGGSQNNNGGNNRNNQNHIQNRNNGGKWCNHCRRNNHNTNECTKQPNNGGKHTNDSRVNKNHHNSGNQNSIKEPCLRCGFYSHKKDNCNAKELPEEEWCDCGCVYHRSTNKCPWNNDAYEREAATARAVGKVCQWCKNDGDGEHTYNDCKEVLKFRRAAMGNILKAYDQLRWCWHCQSEDHLTKACDKPIRHTEKVKWDNAIENEIGPWIRTDISNPDQAYDIDALDEESDVSMTVPNDTAHLRPPGPRYWCLYCENFGHWANAITCPIKNVQRYQNKCPPKFRKATIPERRPFNYQHRPSWTALTPSNNITPSSADFLIAPCTVCSTVVRFPRTAGKLGRTVVCSACGFSNTHPASKKDDVTSDVLKHSRKMMKMFLECQGLIEPSKSKKKKLQEDEDPYKQRPSVHNPVIYHHWPETTPKYMDHGKIFNETDFFNKIGNHQPYFPAIKIQLTPDHLATQDNIDLDINKAGSLGYVPECQNCGAVGNVRDDELDIVICGTDKANTAGCGTGLPQWSGGNNPLLCKCNPILGHVSMPRWVRP